MSAITTEIVVRDGVVFVLPVSPDDAPVLVREGIARRRLVALEGKCHCGGRTLNRAARRRLRKTRGVTQLGFVHEDGCPAVDDVLLEAIGELP